MKLRCYAYPACLLPLLSHLPDTPSQVAVPSAEESQVTAARQHNLMTSSQLSKLARTVRGDEP